MSTFQIRPMGNNITIDYIDAVEHVIMGKIGSKSFSLHWSDGLPKVGCFVGVADFSIESLKEEVEYINDYLMLTNYTFEDIMCLV